MPFLIPAKRKNDEETKKRVMERQCVKMKDSKTTFEHGGLRHITMRREKHNYDRRSFMWAMVYLDLS